MERTGIEPDEVRMEEGRAANDSNPTAASTIPKPLLKTSSFRHIAAESATIISGGAAVISNRIKRIDMAKTMADGMTRNNLGSISSSRFKVFSFT